MSPSLLTTVQAVTFYVILGFELWIILASVLLLLLLLWIKEEIRYGIVFNRTILSTVLVQFRFFQKAGAEIDYLEIYQTKAKDLPK